MSQTNQTTHDPVMAAERLVDVLNRENAALRALDMQGAARLLAEKMDAVADLEAVLAAMADQPRNRTRMASGLRDRLSGLTSEN
jgi:hypothetical protein